MRRSIKGQLISTPAENQIHMVMLPKISLEPLPLNPILKSKSLLTPPPPTLFTLGSEHAY